MCQGFRRPGHKTSEDAASRRKPGAGHPPPHLTAKAHPPPMDVVTTVTQGIAGLDSSESLKGAEPGGQMSFLAHHLRRLRRDGAGRQPREGPLRETT